MRGFSFFELILLLSGIIISLYTLTSDISIETNFAPTVLNGLTSSISVIVALTGALVTLGLSDSLIRFNAGEKRKRIIPTIGFLGLPLALLWTSYSYLLDANYYGALRFAMVGLLFALLVFIDFLGFLTTRSQDIEKGWKPRQ